MKKKKFTLSLLFVVAMAGMPAAHGSAQTQAPTDTVTVPLFEELDEVVVATEKPVIKTDGAKLTYNVEDDPASESSNVLDILKKVPQLSVDGDGNIKLNGSSAFKFQLNGVEAPMLKQYGNQVFQAMPASSVVRIEVITEPGAKEDAEGTAGIINIITEHTRREDGYSGSVSLQGGNRSLTPSFYTVIKKNRVTLSANVNYQWGFAPQKGEQESTQIYQDPAARGRMKSVTGQRAKHHFTSGNLNMSWEPNSRNLFTAGVDVFYINANLYKLYNKSSLFSPSDDLLFSFSQDGKGGMVMLNVSANASYRHNFSTESSNYLVLSYLYNFGKGDLWIDRWYDEMQHYTPDYNYQTQSSVSFNRGHTVQADYANDFNSEHHLMEVGVKGIFRHNTAVSEYGFGKNAQDVAPFNDLATNILQPQNIYAAYASYTGKFSKLSVVGGLRYEHTLMGITERINDKSSFRNHLNDWVPNAAVTWEFNQMSNLRLAYQMRISRPSIEQVNPFELSFSPYEVRKGNPDLTSEHNHIVSLKYSAFGSKFGGNIGLEYNQANDAISSFTYLQTQNGVNTLVTSFDNIGRKQDIALTGFFNWNIIRNMSLMLNGRLAYNRLSAPAEGYSNHGWSGNITGAWNYSVANVYKFSAYAAWFSRSISVQGYSTGFYYYGISASRDFLKDKSLTLGVSANNFLQTKMKFVSHTVTPKVVYDNVARTFSAMNIGVSLTWKFGSLNAQVKKTGVELNNNDINSSSNKGQGSSI